MNRSVYLRHGLFNHQFLKRPSSASSCARSRTNNCTIYPKVYTVTCCNISHLSCLPYVYDHQLLYAINHQHHCCMP
ncbi:hypothetical protein BDA96_05G178100 [Sorghum bicolor]|uniref:Uncharacterized protein n=2 Tax=Sorghum bicolor TaxID=4558 RepID=A0A921QXW1_SORBI|nr:hypothetical protein BDA96_05G178100 [Sorghum bicolor]OQU83719.1 hypothetical protein SORBI_3005G163866 [Sorghum bicolor]